MDPSKKTKRKIPTTRTVEVGRSGKTFAEKLRERPIDEPAAAAPANLEQPIRIRQMRDGDRGYVFQSWMRDYEHSPSVRGMDPRIYALEQQRVIERLLRDCAVAIACDPETEESILGWACGELWGEGIPSTVARIEAEIRGEVAPTSMPGYAVVHYVYVRNNFRRRRIARRLLVEVVGEDALAGLTPLFYSHLPAPVSVQEAVVARVSLEHPRGESTRWVSRPSPALLLAKAPQYNPYLAFAR